MIISKQIIKHASLEIGSSELDKETVKTMVKQLKAGQSFRSIGGVSEDGALPVF